MKILRPSNNYVAGIFFPIGRLETGGTCQYASDRCLEECYGLNKHYDVTVDISEDDKQQIYKFIIEKSLLTICTAIITEMEGMQAKILSWFCTGDCPDKDIDKIWEIIRLLEQEGIIQNGFTRNIDFYHAVHNLAPHIVLTVESKDIDDTPESIDPENGLWAIPDYGKGEVKLYQGTLAYKKEYGSCGWHTTKIIKADLKEIEIATNCYGCYKQKIGCFINKK